MAKFKIDSKDFIDVVGWVTKYYDPRAQNAPLVFALDTEGDSSFYYEDRVSFMKSPVPLTDVDLGDKEELNVAVDANYLKRLASAVRSAGLLEFTWDEEDSGINITSEHGSFTLPLLNVTIPETMKIEPLGEVDDNEYFNSLQRLAKICDAKEGGYFPALVTVDLQFDCEDKKLVMMATDRYTLGEITVDFEPDEDNAVKYFEDHPHIFLPQKIASLIAPTKDNLTSVSIVSGDRGDKYGYAFADGKVAVFSTQEVSPIPYERLKTSALSEAVNHFIVEADEVRKALSVVSSLAWEESTIIFNIDKEGELEVSDNTNSNVLGVLLDGFEIDDDYKVKFNRSVINQAFFPLSTKNVKISWKDDKKAFVFTPLLDDGSEMENVFVLCVPSPSA